MWRRLKLLRKVHKKSIQSVALAADISESYYTKIESGKCEFPLPVDLAKKIADTLDFNWELFYREPDLYMDGLPFYINFKGVNKDTGEVSDIEPKDSPNPARFDGFAYAFGYERTDYK